jgi:hypothetical protein
MIASAVTAPDLALRFVHDLASSVRAEALKAGCFKLSMCTLAAAASKSL